MDIPPDLKEDLMNDPDSLEVIATSMRSARGEDLSEEEIKEWREKSIEILERYPRINDFIDI